MRGREDLLAHVAGQKLLIARLYVHGAFVLLQLFHAGKTIWALLAGERVDALEMIGRARVPAGIDVVVAVVDDGRTPASLRSAVLALLAEQRFIRFAVWRLVVVMSGDITWKYRSLLVSELLMSK